jgi:hypothetical protein
MNNLEKLEIKRLLKELDFIESDYEYKNELINQLELEFIDSVNNYLDNHPTLKEAFDDKINQRFQETINKKIEESKKEVAIVEKEIIEVDPKVKKLYREIVKKTHPDKVKDSDLNDLYIESTKYYEKGDILSIYKICDELNLEYEFGLEENELIKNKITSYKEKIELLQSTFTWKWSSTEDSSKNQIIEDYIKIQLFR